jgi:6-phosphogluconolactonase
MGHVDLRKFSGPDELAQAAANDWLNFLFGPPAPASRVCVALAGGRIAGQFFEKAAEHGSASKLASEEVHFFWSDERCVPPEDPQSNFRLANEPLLKPLRIPQSRIHRIQGEKPGAEACSLAEAEVRRWTSYSAGQQPVLDLVFLGIGENGHVASLFPGEPPSAMDSPEVFRQVRVPKPPPLRITMGYATIAAARQVWVLASGSGKSSALRESLAPEGGTPLARVLSQRAETRIYSDITL